MNQPGPTSNQHPADTSNGTKDDPETTIQCPSCGEQDDLSGEATEDGCIEVRCGSCKTVWQRDPARRCPRCDSTDLYAAPVAVIEKSRGSQLSIVSTTTKYLCWNCDIDLIDNQRQSGTALMPDQLPTL